MQRYQVTLWVNIEAESEQEAKTQASEFLSTVETKHAEWNMCDSDGAWDVEVLEM